jgi:hypothetical protein
MWLTTEELGDVDPITPEHLAEIIDTDAFGKFLVLSASESEFIQAGNDWSPSEECAAYLAQHESDPWTLEYRDGTTGVLFASRHHVTLEQVKATLLSYLGGGTEWHANFEWEEIQPQP